MTAKLLLVAAILALVVAPALGGIVSKDGTKAKMLQGPPSVPSEIRYDFVYNTGGVMDFVPDSGGSSDGWGEWFITTVHNNTPNDLTLVELGFPCAGPPTGTYGWVVWTNMAGLVPPVGDATTAEYFGSFVPVDPNPETWPPTTYTYVDVSFKGIIIDEGSYFCFGYDNAGMGGQTAFNGVDTWAWYSGYWDSDQDWGRTAILQVKANYHGTPTEEAAWSSIKALFR
jgi:hypothetical protein